MLGNYMFFKSYRQPAKVPLQRTFGAMAEWSCRGLQTCLCIVGLARWQSGHAEDCKSLYVGSIPARASKLSIAMRHRVVSIFFPGVAAAYEE
jgi:hypothetical protein